MDDTARILYVEDEALVALPIIDQLEEAGFVVEHVTNAGKAYDSLEASPPAVLLTDIRLPDGIDGWEIARRARELDAGIIVIYASGDSAADWSAKGVPDSVMLQKPFAQAQLVTAISTLLNQRRPRGN